jgi:hypothetical protein
MSLNPSCILDEGRKGFPNVGDAPFSEEGKDVAIAELRAVGFPRGSETIEVREQEQYKNGSEADILSRQGFFSSEVAKRSETEWAKVYTVRAKYCGWKFYRAWYYWIAEAKDMSIPEDVATEFNKDKNNREEVRVEGYAGGQNVIWPVGCYHIDTPRGLEEFMKMLKIEYDKTFKRR